MSFENLHKEIFEKFLKEHYIDKTIGTNSIRKEDGDKLIQNIKKINNNEKVDNDIKKRIRKRNFIIIEDILYQTSENNNNNLKVVFVENLFETLQKVHCEYRGHLGVQRTDQLIKNQYACVPRGVIQYFIKTCPVCSLKQSCRPTRNINIPTKSIIIIKQWEKVQINLIDMRSQEYNGFKWIADVFDHFSNYHILWPMKSKTGIEIAQGLKTKVLPYFGLPKIFQIDNDLEIDTELLDWPGNTCIVNGRFDQENESLKNMIFSIRSLNWPVELNKIMFKLNTSLNPIKLTTPYEMFFNRKPNIEEDAISIDDFNDENIDLSQSTLDDDKEMVKKCFKCNCAYVSVNDDCIFGLDCVNCENWCCQYCLDDYYQSKEYICLNCIAPKLNNIIKNSFNQNESNKRQKRKRKK
jgi:hypothetical protein